MKAIIVGVDPGIYVGIAVFDVNMRLIASTTITNAGKEGAVHEISKHGTPIVVACDVVQPPDSVIQIASYYNARLVHPTNDMHERDKTEMASQFKPGTVHERDAIAAVVHFFNESGNKMRWVEKALREKGLSSIEEEVKRFALSGVRVDDAIKALAPSQKAYEEVLAFAATLPDRPKPEKQERRQENKELLLSLLESNTRMRSRLSLMEEENRLLRQRIEELRQGEMDRRTRMLLQGKDMQISRLRALVNKASQDARRKERDKQQIVDEVSNQHKHSAEAPQKDLKGGEEDSSLVSLVEEYRNAREKEQSKKL